MRKYPSLCLQTVYNLTLSQNWKISKSKNKRKYVFSIRFLQHQQVPFFLSNSSRYYSGGGKDMIFRLTLSNPSLQDILDRNCKKLVDEIKPIVSIHVQRKIHLPRIRVYVPLSETKDVKSEDFLMTSQSIVFFTIAPKSSSIEYR